MSEAQLDATSAPDPWLEDLRRRRSELRESMGAVEQALAAPTPGRAAAWTERMHVALVELSADVREHVSITEGPHGVHEDIVASSPRLISAVDGLCREHQLIQGLVADLLARCDTSAPGAADQGVDAIRAGGTTLLGRLVRHRQRGADLIYEAFATDVGGET